MSKTDIRREFDLYFADMVREAKREGLGQGFDRQVEWDLFINTKIENGDLPASALDWTL